MRSLLAVALAVSALGSTACGAATDPRQSTAPTSPATPSSQPTVPATLIAASPPALASLEPGASPAGPVDAVSRYGYGPQPDPSVTYQPDVVLVGGGPESIRGVSEDGLTWSIDAAAAGVDQLTEGKVMFASSDGVGRVISLERKPDVIDVKLAPVEIGDVISDAHLVLDQKLPIDALTLAEVPQIADGFEDAPSDDLTAEPSPAADSGDRPTGSVPAGMLAALRGFRDDAARSVTAANDSFSRKVGDWNVTGYRSPGAVGLRAERGVGSSTVQGADLKVALDAHIEVSNLHVIADIPVTRGEVGTSHFRVSGITGLVLSLQAGVVNGLSDNRKAKVEIPITLTWPTVIAGFPAKITQKFKFLVQTAFTAKNGNITASAAWDVDGSMGIDGQTVTLPTMTAREPKLIDTLAGVSVGVNGIVVAISFEFGLMFGLPMASAGPVAAFITSLGMTNGSSLGIVQCKQVSITSVITAGAGLQVFDPIKNALAKLGIDVPSQANLITQNIVQEAWVKPDVVACRG